MKSKRSRLLIMAIADKLNEKEMEIIKVNTTLAKTIFRVVKRNSFELYFWDIIWIILTRTKWAPESRQTGGDRVGAKLGLICFQQGLGPLRTQNSDCWAWPDFAREGRPLCLAWVGSPAIAKRQLFFLASFYGAENNWLVLFARHLMLWESEHFMQKVQLCSK